MNPRTDPAQVISRAARSLRRAKTVAEVVLHREDVFANHPEMKALVKRAAVRRKS